MMIITPKNNSIEKTRNALLMLFIILSGFACNGKIEQHNKKPDAIFMRDSIIISLPIFNKCDELLSSSNIEEQTIRPIELPIDSLHLLPAKDFVIGYNLNGDSSTTIYNEPNPNLTYHVISPFGEDIFNPKKIEMKMRPTCLEGETIPSWDVSVNHELIKSISESYNHYSNYKGIYLNLNEFMVIGMESNSLIRTPLIPVITSAEKELCLKALEIDSISSKVDFFTIGHRDKVKRVLALIKSSENQYEGFITVLEIRGNIFKLLFRTEKNMHEYRNFCGQVDLSGDGISDVFLIGYGDYGGYDILFIGKDCKWYVMHIAGPPTC